jgi:hypothetical protein
MDNISIVKFSNSSETGTEDFLFGSHWDLLPAKAQEVVCQIFVHKDPLIRDGVTW